MQRWQGSPATGHAGGRRVGDPAGHAWVTTGGPVVVAAGGSVVVEPWVVLTRWGVGVTGIGHEINSVLKRRSVSTSTHSQLSELHLEHVRPQLPRHEKPVRARNLRDSVQDVGDGALGRGQ